MATTTRDPFETLGITPDFPSREVNRRCEQLRVQLRLTQKTEELERVDEACRTLRDPVQRTTALFWSYLLSESRDVDPASAPSVENHLAWLVAPDTQASQPAGFAIHDTAVLATRVFVAGGSSSTSLERALLGWKAISKNDAFWQAFGERAGARDPLIAAEVTRLREAVLTDAARRLEAGFDASNTTADLNRIRDQVKVIRGCGLPREAQESLVDRATRSTRHRSQDALERLSGEVRELRDSDSSAKSANRLAVREIVCRYVSGPGQDILALRAVDPTNPDTSVDDGLARAFMELAGAALVLGGDIADAIRIGNEGLRVARSESVKVELRADAAQLLIHHHENSAESAWNIGDPASAVAHLELAAESVTEDQPAAVLRETARKIRARLGRGVAAQVEARKAEIRRQIASFHGPLSNLCVPVAPPPPPPPPEPKSSAPPPGPKPSAPPPGPKPSAPPPGPKPSALPPEGPSPRPQPKRWPVLLLTVFLASLLWLLGPWRSWQVAPPPVTPRNTPVLIAVEVSPSPTHTPAREPTVAKPAVQPAEPTITPSPIPSPTASPTPSSTPTEAGKLSISSDGLFDPAPGSIQSANGYTRWETYPGFVTGGRPFTYEVAIGDTPVRGGIVLSLNDVDRPDITWLFTVAGDTWKLDEVVGESVNPWVPQRSFLSPVKGPIKSVQLVVRGREGTLYVNGVRVSGDDKILFPEKLGTDWKVGIGVAPGNDALAPGSGTIEFDSVRVTFDPE